MARKDTLYCSFCGKSQHEVKKLLAGPIAFICDECVELCSDIVDEERMAKCLALPREFDVGKNLNLLEQIKFESIWEMLQEGGIQKFEGTINLREIFVALSAILKVRLRPMLQEEGRRARISELRAKISESERRIREELEPELSRDRAELEVLEGAYLPSS